MAEKPYTMEEMKALLEQAKIFAREAPMRGIEWLYRNKPPAYYRDIYENNNNIMSVIEKDLGGHPGSPINGQMCGLFFLANVQGNGKPKNFSPFGSRRFMVPCEHLLTGINLYFADFYCLNKEKPHYVILVVTRPNSRADEWCRTKLPILEPENPFLWIESVGPSKKRNRPSVKVECNARVLVEVFYTENINITQFVDEYGSYFYNTMSSGTSTAGGVPRNPDCEECALPESPSSNIDCAKAQTDPALPDSVKENTSTDQADKAPEIV